MPTVQEIAASFNLKIVGSPTTEIVRATSLDDQAEDAITWVKSAAFIEKIEKGIVLLSADLNFEPKPGIIYLVTADSPKLVFSNILKTYFSPPVDYYLLNDVEKHRTNPNLKIADFVFIGQNVSIGNGTVIFPNVVIEANSIIGQNCVIKSHVSIGTEGLGLELNPETGILEKFPQLGKVIFEDFVEIGPTSTVRRGALKNTIVRKGTKIGSMTNIGHNCDIGENCILTAGIVVSGSSKVGKHVFIGVNASIRNAVNIGSHVQIGMGSVVVKDVEDHTTVIGNPAKVKG